MMKEITNGVEETHAVGIAHRDIKPGNIFIIEKKKNGTKTFEDINYKLGDFGEAKKIDKNNIYKKSLFQIEPRGSPKYMAPEVLNSYKKKIYDNYDLMRTDVYSLGKAFEEI